jgi:hypothetical protein
MSPLELECELAKTTSRRRFSILVQAAIPLEALNLCPHECHSPEINAAIQNALTLIREEIRSFNEHQEFIGDGEWKESLA